MIKQLDNESHPLVAQMRIRSVTTKIIRDSFACINIINFLQVGCFRTLEMSVGNKKNSCMVS